MGVKIWHTVVILLLYHISPIFTQEERCTYMEEIPRPDRPNMPFPNFEGTTWSQVALLPAEDREDVCMEDWMPGTASAGTQIIYMEEEIEGEVAIARLNYNGESPPELLPFLTGSYNLLGPALRRGANDNSWYLVITQRQDYETPGMQLYMFRISVPGETLIATVALQIVNIDDNAPIIQNFDPCQVDEMGDARLTECVYTVTDADGEISTRFMTFQIESDRGDERIFYMEGQTIPGDWFRMNMTLGIREPLDFEANALHIFRVTAMDSLPNNHTVTMMVQVENVEHRPPRWMEIFAVQQFDEKQAHNFTVRAIDGDTGINQDIYYDLITEEPDLFSIETIPGGQHGGILIVNPIDRDELQREVFQMTIVAYKSNNRSSYREADVAIIVNDINDQRPEPIGPKEFRINILEETALTLSLGDEFGFHDRDLGPNAQYNVRLESEYPEGVAEAFYIAPGVGYQRQTFIMGTINHTMLDYEVEEFQHISIKVIATDLNDTMINGTITVFIDLVNWNDEVPVFERDVQEVGFNETEGAGFYVGTVLAIDRDIDDRVVHTLMGNAVEYLSINETTGEIYVAVDDAFDYHRQNELFVQVRADDTLMAPYHTVTSQLIIRLFDVNNTPPSLRLPRGNPQVEENVEDGFVITQNITATDPDTTAELVFEIDWSTSEANKQGRVTDPREFLDCVEIETIYPQVNSRGTAIGRLVVREIRPGVTIDFEEFEMLYLSVRVRDINTVYGEDNDVSTLAITIIDMNDNAPAWAEGTLAQELRVREVSAAGVVVGSVLATDIDGPLYNRVRYTIRPREDTPENLIRIDFNTGQISVDQGGAIDADVPPRDNLYYTVVASDRCYAEDPTECPPDPTYWDTEGNITIHIIDTNNKVPQAEPERFVTEHHCEGPDPEVYTVCIYENAPNGFEILQLIASDLDRDEIYHTVHYQINFAVNQRLLSFFDMEQDSGQLLVHNRTGELLDRDGEEPTHRIFFNIIDNFFSGGDGNRNQMEFSILVVLLDENDNAPELPAPEGLSWTISEGLDEGVRLSPDIYAPDRDEPDTDNSRVGYEIRTLTLTDRDVTAPDLFRMIQIQNVTGELETAMPLRGYWGNYDIRIRAFDHGIPQQDSEEVYQLVITPYNFHHPVFVFPTQGMLIRLAREWASVNSPLMTVRDEPLQLISATDEDGLHAGQVTFSVTGDADASSYFTVENTQNNVGTLVLTQPLTENIREFQVTLRATDQGDDPGPLFSETTIRLVFVPTRGDPIFETTTAQVAIFEGDGGLSERHQLPLASEPKNHLCDGDCYDIYYRIIDGNSAGHFALDPSTNILYVLSELDRAEATSHALVVAASNSPDAATAFPDSTLTVTVNVREANPRPRFVEHLYTAGISMQDAINRELLTVQATHTENAVLRYEMDASSMEVDESLEAVRETAFILNATTGVLTLNIQPTASMHGMFVFNVTATDPAGETDTARVQIYLVSSINLVVFTFINELQTIEQNRDFIAETFSNGFSMLCNIDAIVPATDASGIARLNHTELRAHFIRDDVPVPSSVIEELRSETILLSAIQMALNSRQLVLEDFVTGTSPEAGTDSNQITVYVLAVLSALLAFMCLVLLLTFIIRTRALNRRLAALSMTKYGSADSGLNRVGLAAPGTNKHATEGSNPIWNEAIKAPDFDSISDTSDDSDLIGIEDLPQFRNDYFPGDNISDQDLMAFEQQKPVASHDNNFGFTSSPFNPEFANKSARR